MMGLESASIHLTVRSHIQTFISLKTNEPITIKFYLNHQWGREKAVIGFGPNRIRTLVSKATDGYHRVIMGKTVSLSFSDFFKAILFMRVD